MTETNLDRKEAMKALRKERAEILERVAATVKEQTRVKKAITAALKDGPASPPAVAQTTGIPVDTVFWTLMSMKKYGSVVEAGDEDEYYLYALSGK
jgi:predicted Rossmann fold nucleotide-binding protein DprA/Smf involved in DNA uptake